MRKLHAGGSVFIILIGLLSLNHAYARMPVWSFSPLTDTNILISSNGIAIVQYNVTNQSRRTHTLQMIPISGIKATGCAAPLGYHESCILNLAITGSALQGNVVAGPVLCDRGNRNQCYHPSQGSELYITLTNTQQYAVAVGGSTLSTPNPPISYISSDGGSNWIPSSTEPASLGSGDLYGVACSNTGLTCTAVGFNQSNNESFSYFSVDRGANWLASTTQPSSLGGGILRAVACSSNGLACAAVGYNAMINESMSYVSKDGGKNWAASLTQPTSIGEGILLDVSCSSDGQMCVAVGAGVTGETPLSYISTDGGENWTASITQPNSLGEGELVGVACSSTGKICTAVGINFINDNSLSYVSTDSGENWTASLTQPSSLGQGVLYSVACSSDGQRCVAVGAKVFSIGPIAYTSTDGGLNWTASTTQPTTGELVSVACSSNGFACTAVGVTSSPLEEPISYESIDGGVTWALSTTQPTASGEGYLYSVTMSKI